MSSVRTQLKEFLGSANDWEKMSTPIPGIFVVKIPRTKNQGARLSIEMNPLNDIGRPVKKTGFFIARFYRSQRVQ